MRPSHVVPYWNNITSQTSTKLWLPKINADLPHRSNRTLADTWFTSSMTSSWSGVMSRLRSPSGARGRQPERLFSNQNLGDFLAAHASPVPTVRKTKKIRIYPTVEQVKIFRLWTRATRHVYNATLQLLASTKGTAPEWRDVAKVIFKDLPESIRVAPFQVKKMAVKEAWDAWRRAKKRSMFSSGMQGVKFKSRKDPTQSCYIPKVSVKPGGLYPGLTGDGLRYSEPLPKNPCDSRLVLRQKRWYICVPFKVPVPKTKGEVRVVALDPGVRSFLTYYSEDSIGKIGDGDMTAIHKLCVYLDELLGRIADAPTRKRRRLQKAATKMRMRIRHLVDEVHHKAAKFLTDNFDIILLPHFEVQGMTARTRRRISRKTVLGMLNWAHFRFRQFLQHKARSKGKVVILVNEAYTSKTCSWSGHVIKNLGSRKVVRCPETGISLDRDVNGARGILLRAISEVPELRSLLTDPELRNLSTDLEPLTLAEAC